MALAVSPTLKSANRLLDAKIELVWNLKQQQRELKKKCEPLEAEVKRLVTVLGGEHVTANGLTAKVITPQGWSVDVAKLVERLGLGKVINLLTVQEGLFRQAVESGGLGKLPVAVAHLEGKAPQLRLTQK